MRPSLRMASILALLFFLLVPAMVSADDAGTPRVLLSDFGCGEELSPALVQALRDHEERRLGPEARLRRQSPDDARVIAMLEAARVITATQESR